MGDYLMKFEQEYFDTIKHNCDIIFDVGVGDFSVFFEEPNLEVHYFEPFKRSYDLLNGLDIKNKKYFINNFGLSDSNEIVQYYEEGSLFDRKLTNKILEECLVKTGKEYCIENNISHIDFLKIDVEGMETKVLLGFGDFLKNVRYIQFEYGIGLQDAGSNLSEITQLLNEYGFKDFYRDGNVKLENSNDFWQWCNINSENVNFIK
jgi:FkbM family methyltransferase